MHDEVTGLPPDRPAIREGPHTTIGHTKFKVDVVDGWPTTRTSIEPRRCVCGKPLISYRYPDHMTYDDALAELDHAHNFLTHRLPDGRISVVGVCPDGIGLTVL